MATIYTTSFAIGTTASQIKDYFESLDDRFVGTISGTTLSLEIAGVLTWTFNVEDSYWRSPFTVTINGTTSGNVNNPYGLKQCITVISDNFISIHLTDPDGRRALFVYENIDGVEYAGYFSNTAMSQPYRDLGGATMYKIGDTSLTYAYATLLPYTAQAGYIDIVNNAIMVNGNSKAGTTSDLKSCSEVAAGSTITSDGVNYYALGSHILIAID